MMEETPGLWIRLVSTLHGEVSANELEAYRRASLAVFELLDQAEEERLTAAAEGKTPWTMLPAKQTELACTWNAFVLQTLGNAFLDADYRDHPATRGFVPPITADQVLRFYTPVEGWITCAQSAHANPSYRIDIAVPSPIPAWSEVEPCPNSHLHGMLDAMRAIRDHAQAAMNALDNAADLSKEQTEQRGKIREIFAAALSKARYADDMHRQNPSREVHETIEGYLKTAIEQFYLLGQYAAMPQTVPLIAPALAPPMTPAVTALPGQTGFDPWCLTSALARKAYASDREAQKAVETLWKIDPDPARTLTILAEITAAYTRGDITYATDRFNKPIGYFFCCPWGTVYQVVRPVVLGGVKLAPLQQFVYDVTAEGYNLGVPFRRQIKIGDYRPTTEFEYGDPDEEPDH